MAQDRQMWRTVITHLNPINCKIWTLNDNDDDDDEEIIIMQKKN